MKLASAIALALMTTAAAQAQPFQAAQSTQTTTRAAVRYHLFVTYFAQSGVTTAIQLGPFLNATACANAAQLIATKVAIGATACLKDQ
jgi:hypothetical protein